MTQTHHRYHGLDSLRSLAIILVMFWHQLSAGGPSWLYHLARFGWTGVDLFFVLSGFLIGSQLLTAVAQGQAPSLKEFYIKRFFRILPNYYTVLALYLLIPGFRDYPVMAPLWKFVTFTQNFNTRSLTEGAFDHAWSLCIEEHFYLILPLTIVVLHKKIRTRGTIAFATCIALLGVVLRAVSHIHFVAPMNPAVYSDALEDAFTRWIYNPTYNRLDGLMLGVLLAATYRLRKDLWAKIENLGNPLFAAGATSLLVGFFVARNQYSFISSIASFPFISLGYAAWVAAAMSKNCIVFKRPIPGTQTIALLAFALYLLDKPMIHLGHKVAEKYLGFAPNSTLGLLSTLPFVFGAAWILHNVVEKPMLQMRDRVLAKL